MNRETFLIMSVCLTMFASQAAAAGLNSTLPADQVATAAQNAQGTITAARFQELRENYLDTKKAYDTAKAATDGTYSPADLRELAEKYNLAYRQYVEATQKRIFN